MQLSTIDLNDFSVIQRKTKWLPMTFGLVVEDVEEGSSGFK